MRNRWVVRVIWLVPERMAHGHDCVELLIEQLRYAGLLRTHDDASEMIIDGKRYLKSVFDILPPHGVDSQRWAEHNASRMQSFPINAVAAPEWSNSK